ncbi:zinc carboxypeptidase [Phycicoccus sp. CSK15P-2]|nr:zinc carboxypeptidase [Phycicoccus sp. CSK15P-2]
MALATAAVLAVGVSGVSLAAPSPPDDTPRLVHVLAPTAAERTDVSELGLDTTEHADATGIDVILHGEADARRLREAGYRWRVVDADLAKTARENAAADRRYAAATKKSGLPSGRTSYRTLDEVNDELAALARRYPSLVRLFTLPNRTVEGRPVRGIEITRGARSVDDGKPAFLLMGAHHAREWPSVEHSMEFAYDLLENRRRDGRAREILRDVRTIIVPVVNPDGFDISRSAAPLGDFSLFDYEMKRKNCSVSGSTPAAYLTGTCEDNPAGRLRGTDLNRNYPGFWGGPGASTNWSSDTFRGDGPGDTPEVGNIKRLISSRQVTNLVTNHTYSNLVLRPPSIASTGWAPDEPVYRALGADLAEPNGYTNQAAFQLYDTSGSVEDWSYWQTGGLGFTFEIGPDEFHPPYETGVVAEYLGLQPAAGAGKGGNRESFYRMAQATRDRSLHSTLVGTAPKGTVLTVSKTFQAFTSPVIASDGTEGDPVAYQNDLSSTLRPDGRFTWDVNPSTRPEVAGRYGRDPLAPPQPSAELANPAGIPEEGEAEESTFTVEGLPRYDNATAEVRVSWPDADVDWDVYVYDEDGRQVASAASLDDPEVALLVDPVPGRYTVRVENYAGGASSDWTGEVEFLSPTPAAYTGVKEAWTLTCTNRSGKVLAERQVVVDRGQQVWVGTVCRKPKD